MRKFLCPIMVLALFACSKQDILAQGNFQDSLIRTHGFTPYKIISRQDTINFYVHQGKEKRARNLVIFLSGSTPDPLFTYERKDGKLLSYFWGHQDYKLLPEDCAYIVIAKPGMAGMIDEAGLNTRKPPRIYLEKNSLDYRVWQADEVIRFSYKKLLNKVGKVLVYGHSEGFNVVAKLLTVNKTITHAGLWAGSAMPDYYDFMLFNKKSLLSGQLSDSASTRQIDTLLDNYRKIFAEPHSTASKSIYTNKRWASYAEPAVNYLNKVNIPLYLISATRDDNAPYESSFLVPLEFIRLHKNNLTYKTCIGCNHSLVTDNGKGDRLSYWNDYFKDMITWAGIK